MGADAVTTIIYHRVVPDRHEDYLRWQERITEASSAFPGYRGTQRFAPGVVTHNDCEFVTVLQFDTPELLKGWMESDIRKELLAEAENFTYGKLKVASFQGLEHWFTSGEGPPRYKMTFITFLTIWPLVHFLPPQVESVLGQGPLLNEIISVAMMTVIMSYIALPLASRLFGFWLREGRS